MQVQFEIRTGSACKTMNACQHVLSGRDDPGLDYKAKQSVEYDL